MVLTTQLHPLLSVPRFTGQRSLSTTWTGGFIGRTCVWAQVALGFSHCLPTDSRQLWTNRLTFLDPVLIKQNILDLSFSIQIVWTINHLHFIPRRLGIKEPRCELTLCAGILVGGRSGIHLLANTELGDSSIFFHVENSEILQNIK